MLGVRAETLAAHGRVSEATAREMATGALARSGADIAVAVTGVAGPAGGHAGQAGRARLLRVGAPRRRGRVAHRAFRGRPGGRARGDRRAALRGLIERALRR